MKKIVLFALLMVLVLTVFVGCKYTGPSEEQIKKDIGDYWEGWKNESATTYEILDIHIEYADCKDGIYKAEVHVLKYKRKGKYVEGGEEEIDYPKGVRVYNLEYKHYDTGGWKFEAVETQ